MEMRRIPARFDALYSVPEMSVWTADIPDMGTLGRARKTSPVHSSCSLQNATSHCVVPWAVSTVDIQEQRVI
jgi:hypothetical protein